MRYIISIITTLYAVTAFGNSFQEIAAKIEKLPPDEKESINIQLRWIGYCYGIVGVVEGRREQESKEKLDADLERRLSATSTDKLENIRTFASELRESYPIVYENFIETEPSLRTNDDRNKAFSNVHFGEKRKNIESKAIRKLDLIGHSFDVVYDYKSIGDQDILHEVSFILTLESTDDILVKQKLGKIKDLFTERFGAPKIDKKEFSENHSDELFQRQLQWLDGEWKEVTVWWMQTLGEEETRSETWLWDAEYEYTKTDTLMIKITSTKINRQSIEREASLF